MDGEREMGGWRERWVGGWMERNGWLDDREGGMDEWMGERWVGGEKDG